MRIYKYTVAGSVKHHSFTLIEMLVVIAIIGIIASMLMPALHNAIGSAHAITCANNQKQLSFVSSCYINDYNGNFLISVDKKPKWPTYLINSGYINNDDFPRCPSNSYIQGAPNSTYGVSLWPSNTVGGSTPWVNYSKPTTEGIYNINFNKVITPSKQLFFADSIYKSSSSSYYKKQFYLLWSIYGCTSGNVQGCPQTRHNDRANCLMADGHVETRGLFDFGDLTNQAYFILDSTANEVIIPVP